jgi:hypothetical protein
MMTTTKKTTREWWMKTKSNPSEPAPADPVLVRYRQYAEVLTGTGTAIPKLLAEQRTLQAQVGRAEIEGGDDLRQLRERLGDISDALASAARQRSAASDGLVSLGADLRAARADVAQELAEITHRTVTDFQKRWNQAVAELSRLHAEAGLLSRALRANVTAVPPYVATPSADGTRTLVTFNGHLTDCVMLPPEVSAITARLDQLDAAGHLVAGLGQANELTTRHHVLCSQRRTPSRMEGLFEVVKEFSYLGTQFTRGMLLDRTVLPDGVLYRFQLGRDLRAVEDSAVAA